MLFYGPEGAAQYTVPKRSGVSAIYAAALWVGSTVGGEFRASGTTYGQGGRNNDYFEFWPGPLDDGTAALPDPADCSAYDRIWTVAATDVAAYEAGAAPSDDLAEWPTGLGAPTRDAGGQPVQPTRRDQRIDLAAGERPDLLGRQTAFWVMNDVGNVHRSFGSAPLGVEVRVLAGAFSDPASALLSTATAYRFEIVNRSPETLNDLRAGFFLEWDLGNGADDYVGSDSTRSLGVVYNADNNDNGAYGNAPPAMGLDLLTGAYSVMYAVGGDGNRRDPYNAVGVDRVMRGIWPDGTPMTASGSGYGTAGRRTRWAYSGRAETGAYWSELDASVESGRQPTTTGDRRMFMSSTAVTLAPGEATAVDAVLLYARGSDHLRSVVKLREASSTFQAQYDAGRHFPARVRPVARDAGPASGALALSVRPNPAADRLTAEITLAHPGAVRLRLVDVLGRTVRDVTATRPAGAAALAVPLGGLAAGLYVVRVEAAGAHATQTVTVTR